jgi:hypothetical protein
MMWPGLAGDEWSSGRVAPVWAWAVEADRRWSSGVHKAAVPVKDRRQAGQRERSLSPSADSATSS